MVEIYHEKQQGFICAQHCLNNLLQGPYFTAIDLSDIAHQLDERERSALETTSSRTACFNNDETGFFSIQVIIQALENLDLQVEPLLSKSSEAQAAKEFPAGQSAFICNYQQHWFTVRKLGHQWFNLNSMLPSPTLISDTYLSLYLTQLCNEGHSIYVVVGALPECEADTYLRSHPVPKVYSGKGTATPSSHPTPAYDEENDVELRRALEISLEEEESQDSCLQRILSKTGRQSEDEDLSRALQMSLQQTACALRSSDNNEDDDELKAAIALSLQKNFIQEEHPSPTTTSDRDLEALRLRRQAHFSKISK